MITLETPVYDELCDKEWIVTNGLGGYASSTIVGTNTRRYHGLFVASLNPPVERVLLVAKVEETLIVNGREHRISTNRYAEVVHPEGYRYFMKFERRPLPCSTFQADNCKLEKTVFMVHGSNTTIVEYKNSGEEKFQIQLNPLYSYRDFHGLLNERSDYHFHAKILGKNHIISACEGAPPLYFRYSDGIYMDGRNWHHNLHYVREFERGQAYSEDYYSMGYISHYLEPGQSLYLTFSMDNKMLGESPDQLKKAELERLTTLAGNETQNQFLADLLVAGDQFLVKRKSTESFSIIAGYHWFSDWGRDSMIALRGLLIAAGKKEEAKSVIHTFLAYVNKGIVPNRFPDYTGDKPEYNTVDATLWLFVAVYEYNQRFQDTEFLKEIQPRLEEILNHHLKGTIHDIRVLDNGLLRAGSPQVQITWMDAKTGDHVFTPRHGCSVEINALWYNALCIYQYVCEQLQEKTPAVFSKLLPKIKKAFRTNFWNEEAYLNDVVSDEGHPDPSIRPNQVFAVSLPFSLLTKKEEKQVVENVKRHLFTPFGLRTLSPEDPAFKKTYEGDLWNRDAAYHQGTSWPFLLPEYFIAFLKVNNYSSKARKSVIEQLEPLRQHFYEQDCLYGISEIFDGLEPSRGKGCVQQAWSVSNLIWLLTKMNEVKLEEQSASAVGSR